MCLPVRLFWALRVRVCVGTCGGGGVGDTGLGLVGGREAEVEINRGILCI